MGSQALQRIKILDLSRYLPGGYATQLFADFGAEVIKVEDTNLGDFCRHEQPVINDISYYFSALGRNKKSISLNLKEHDARKAFYALVKDADVVIESFRPGTTKKLGIDYETLRAINSQIIYCSLSGYGQDDPRSQKPLHDINMQAQSGYLSLNGGVKAPLHLCDLATAMVSAQSILIALLERNITHRGYYIDISMFDSFIWWNSLIDSRWSFQNNTISEDSIAFPATCPYYNLYETKDGKKLAFGLIEEKFWDIFCTSSGCEEPLDKTSRESYEKVKEIVASKTMDEWQAWIDDKDVCIAPVIDKTSAIEQILELEPHMMDYIADPRVGTTIQTNLPHAINLIRPHLQDFTPAPALGEQTREILHGVGYSDKAIDGLLASGAARETNSSGN